MTNYVIEIADAQRAGEIDALIWRLVLKGKSSREIATALADDFSLDVSYSTVARYLIRHRAAMA